MDKDMLNSAIIGGLVIALLSSLPYISAANILCCMWVVLGGLLSVYIYKRCSKKQINAAKGALLGLISALVAAPCSTFLKYIIRLVLIPSTSMMQELFYVPGMHSSMIRPMYVSMFSGLSILGIFFSLIINIIIFSIFSTIGGMVGGIIWKQRSKK